ncbi:MAG: uL22 family ribosomal protein [bacterium]|nr:uL22 family ribosomal protein [bacterium]
MQLQTYLKNIKASPKKVRFMVPAIKKMKPTEAIKYLFYAKEKSARILYKAIKSAISNAKNALKVPEDLLEFKLLIVEQGPKLKRFKPGSRGNAKPIVHKFTHIKIVLETKDQVNKVDKK